MRVKLFGLFFTLFLLRAGAFAFAADLFDPTFNNTGKLFSPLGGISQINALILLPDGGTVAGGFLKTSNGEKNGFLIRSDSKGQPVLSFGNNGIKIFDFAPGFDDEITAIILSEDKILIGGYAVVSKNGIQRKDFTLSRLKLADGSFDETFNNGNPLIRNLLNQAESLPSVFVRNLALQSNGKIVVGLNMVQRTVVLDLNEFRSSDDENLMNAIVIARFNSLGTLDENFGNKFDVDGKGMRFLNGFFFDASALALKSLAVQQDNKIIIGGSIENGKAVALVRFDSEGVAFDPNFSDRGVWKYDLSNGNQSSQLVSILIQPDHKILIAGTAQGDFAIARCEVDCKSPNNGLDNSFASNGIQLTDMGQGEQDVLSDIALQSNGKIVAVGATRRSSAAEPSLLSIVRYDSIGNRDSTFNGNGILTTRFTENKNSRAEVVAVQSDEKIIVAGEVATQFGTDDQFVIARFLEKPLSAPINDPSPATPVKPADSLGSGSTSSGGCELTSESRGTFLFFFLSLIPFLYLRFRQLKV